MIALHVEPGIVKTPEEFFGDNFPGYSIGLDGYVRGPPEYRVSAKGPKVNFNHHEDVDRLATRSTCAQVAMAIKQGLFSAFSHDNEPYVNAYVNDCDQDVCLSVWLLENHERIDRERSEPLITRLVAVTDFLDATAGAYPISPSTNVRKELAWVFRPYIEARMDGMVPFMKQPEMRNVIETIGNRITDYTLGRGAKATLDTRLEFIGGGDNWRLIREIGYDARADLLSKGITAFVSVRENGNGKFSYSIGKISPFVDFPIVELYSELNHAEDSTEIDAANRWGGSDMIGGSPRQTGSKLAPKDVERVINDYIQSRNADKK